MGGSTALHSAAILGSVELAKEALESGDIDVDLEAQVGMQRLSHAQAASVWPLQCGSAACVCLSTECTRMRGMACSFQQQNQHVQSIQLGGIVYEQFNCSTLLVHAWAMRASPAGMIPTNGPTKPCTHTSCRIRVARPCTWPPCTATCTCWQCCLRMALTQTRRLRWVGWELWRLFTS